MVGSWLQPDLNAILSIFSLYAGVILGYPRRHAAFPVRLTRLFAHVLCNSPYGLKQTQNMSGSVLLTTEASQLSVGIAGKQHCINIEDSLMIVKKVQQIDKFT